MVEPAVAAVRLSRTFTTGPRRQRRVIDAVRNVSFEVAPGERIAFIGPNGAGKSTCIKMLTGILRPTSGTARVLGITPWEHRRELSRRIGTVFGQRSQLWQELPARATMRMLGSIFGLSRDATVRRIDQLAELLDASDLLDQPVRTLSLGQRMRCELAACLLHSPSLLFLDEPTVGLDLLAKQTLRELILRLNAVDSTTVFLTSHDVADIEFVAQRVIVINHGTLIYDASVDDMRAELLASHQTVTVVDPPLDSLIADIYRRPQ